MIKNVDGVDIEMTDDEIAAFENDRAIANALILPASVSARQFKLQLLASGQLDLVNGWIATQSRAVQIAYEYSGSFLREEPMMAAGFAAMGFSCQEIDEFFIEASAL